MDLKTLNTKSDAETGAELHLRHPALGHPLYSGEGADGDGRLVDPSKPHERVCVIVRGAESEKAQAQARKAQSLRMKRKNISLDDAAEFGLKYACTLVIGFRGITDNGKPLEATDENKRLFFKQSDNLVQQVVEFAEESSNFYKGASTSST